MKAMAEARGLEPETWRHYYSAGTSSALDSADLHASLGGTDDKTYKAGAPARECGSGPGKLALLACSPVHFE